MSKHSLHSYGFHFMTPPLYDIVNFVELVLSESQIFLHNISIVKHLFL